VGRGPFSAPIAAVAADSATRAAFDEVSRELVAARTEGRMVLRLPLTAVDETYLVRDRIEVAEEDMAALIASLRMRGQQMPVEVADLGDGRYGLISGWRRLMALRRISAEDDTAGHVLALLRRPEVAADAYLAMVEENEIRSGLSFYERARIVVRAADRGVYPDDRAALSHLFAAAPRARRSKIGSFVRLVRAFEAGEGMRVKSSVQGLFFPASLSEKLGLTLVAAVDRDPGIAGRIAGDLAAQPPEDAGEEAVRIAAFLRGQEGDMSRPAAKPAPSPLAMTDAGMLGALPRIDVLSAGRIALSGPGVEDPQFLKALNGWLSGRVQTETAPADRD